MAKQIRLTKAAIDALAPAAAGTRDTYNIIDVSGLTLRVTHAGVKTFSVHKRVRGAQLERVTLGRYGERTLEQVKLEAMRIITGMAGGESRASTVRTHKEAITLAELLDEFLKNKRSRRGAYLTEVTKRDYQNTFKVHLSKWQSRKLSGVTEEDVVALHKRVGRDHPHTANRCLALVSSLYNYAKGRKLFTGTNPAAGIQKFPEDSRERFLQADELPRFFEAVAAEENQTIRDYVLISLLTGARRSNVLAMRWQDVNLERAEWRIPVTKGGTSQTVTLSPEAVEILLARKPEDDVEFVFASIGKTGHLTEPKTGWKRILERAGIEDLRLHDLRRTLGSWQAKSGASLAIIGKSLNHKSTSTTAIYARLDLDPVRASVNTATMAMLEAAGVKKKAEVKRIKGGK
ncbi:MAG: tyrosine-type recombinase/integrase [Thiobacillaceae bacterium]